MSTGLVLTYISVLVLLYVLGRSFWKPLFVLFRLCFQCAIGALGIYLFNAVAATWDVVIPLNPFNALWTGLLGLPGFLSLLAIKYWIRV